jgi:hypothetical protein
MLPPGKARVSDLSFSLWKEPTQSTKASEHLDANSRRRGRSWSLGQVTRSVAVGGSRSQPMTLLYSSAVRLTGSVARDRKPRITSLSGVSSPGFMRVRAAAQIACMYSREPRCTGVNCNPNSALLLWPGPHRRPRTLVQSPAVGDCPDDPGADLPGTPESLGYLVRYSHS